MEDIAYSGPSPNQRHSVDAGLTLYSQIGSHWPGATDAER
jgi:hypothetical protein